MLANLQLSSWNRKNHAIVLVVKRKVDFKNFVFIAFFQKKLFIANFLKIFFIAMISNYGKILQTQNAAQDWTFEKSLQSIRNEWNKREWKKKKVKIFTNDFSPIVYLILHQNLLSTNHLSYWNYVVC